MTVEHEPKGTEAEEESETATGSEEPGSEQTDEAPEELHHSDPDLPENPDEISDSNLEALLSPGTRMDLSPKGRAASKALLSLSRAARAFLLYDASNQAIRVFLKAIQDSFTDYLESYGPLILSVRPFELAVDSEVVYDEEDRERSLAFRLFRDGVRRLAVFDDVEWSELLKLLEILSIRYTGIRLNEDDIVTLLWKANFQHIEVEAVEGFVPEEEDFDEDEFYQQDIDTALKGQGGFTLDEGETGEEGSGEGGPEGEGGSGGEPGAPGEGVDPAELDANIDPARMSLHHGDEAEGDAAHEEGLESGGAQLPHEMHDAVGDPGHTEDPETEKEVALATGTSIIPPDMDLPSPKLPVVRQATWAPIDPETTEALIEESTVRALPEDCLVLVETLLSMVEKPNEPIVLEEVAPLLTEVRDFMLTEGHLPNLMKLLENVADFAANMGEDEEAQRLVQSFANTHALSRLIRSVPSSTHEPPQEFYDLLEKLPGDHLNTLIEILKNERVVGSRRITRQLIEHFIPGREPFVRECLQQMAGAVAADLLRCLSIVNMDAAWDTVLEYAAGDDVDTQLECLHVLNRADQTPRVRGYLGKLLTAKDVQVRMRAITLLGEHQQKETYPVLFRHLTSARAVSVDEAMALGAAMTTVSSGESLEQYRAWIKPKGLFKKLKPVPRAYWQAALSGLVFVNEAEADELLKALASRADSDTTKLCVQARMKRHRRLRGVVEPGAEQAVQSDVNQDSAAQGDVNEAPATQAAQGDVNEDSAAQAAQDDVNEDPQPAPRTQDE